MTKKKFFITFLLIVIPVLLLAQEHENLKAGKSFWYYIFSVKYLAVYLFAGLSLFFLWYKKFSQRTRVIVVSSAFVIFGILPLLADYLFITPSPVCASTKPFFMGLQPRFLATLAAIGVLSVISVKGFCSTACPVGGLQELLYKIPSKKYKIPFRISNSVRIGLFLLFLVIVIIFKTSAYYYYNLFDLIHWNFNLPLFELIEFLVFLVLILTAAVFFFKPFCYLICPMGLLTWILEHFSFLKIRFDKNKCTDCGVCEKKAPCSSVNSIIKEKAIRGDCHLCGECLNACNFDALYFGRAKK